MKILQAGNLTNLGYVTTRELRKNDIDSELIMEANPKKTSDPKLFDQNLDDNYPNWIKFYDRTKSGWKRKIIKTMRDKKYDIIHSYTELIIFSYLSRRHYIANPTGSDLRELAFSNSIRGILLRRALHKAKVVIAASPEVLDLLSKLKVKSGIFLPVLMDLELFKPNEFHSKSDKLIIFHPSNLDWKSKGNNNIVKGFAKFVKEQPNSQLLIVDRGINSKKTHELVMKLSLEKNVDFIKGPLDFSEMIKYYDKSDVIADQFIIGEFGGIGRESLCMGKPVLGFYDINNYKKIFGEPPPVINAQSPNEISEQLHFLSDQSIREKLGKKGREWASKYHSSKINIKKLKIIYESVLDNENPSDIRQRLKTLKI